MMELVNATNLSFPRVKLVDVSPRFYASRHPTSIVDGQCSVVESQSEDVSPLWMKGSNRNPGCGSLRL